VTNTVTSSAPQQDFAVQGELPLDEVISQYDVYATSDERLIVTADGFGGATVLRVEGNYTVDYIMKNRRKFPREEAACIFAEKLNQGLVQWPCGEGD